MNKQTSIDDYKQTIERLQKECTEKTDLNIKLMERVQELEQKLTIALNSLNDIATFDNYIVAQLDAQQALQKISEVN